MSSDNQKNSVITGTLEDAEKAQKMANRLRDYCFSGNPMVAEELVKQWNEEPSVLERFFPRLFASKVTQAKQGMTVAMLEEMKSNGVEMLKIHHDAYIRVLKANASQIIEVEIANAYRIIEVEKARVEASVTVEKLRFLEELQRFINEIVGKIVRESTESNKGMVRFFKTETENINSQYPAGVSNKFRDAELQHIDYVMDKHKDVVKEMVDDAIKTIKDRSKLLNNYFNK